MGSATRVAAVVLGGILLATGAGCGGGGGGSTAATGSGPPPDPPYTAGVYEPPANFAAYCATPRTGTDPVTGAAYPDKLGSAVWENNWLRSWTNYYYLWYSEVPDVNPDADPTATYFTLMKTPLTTPTGQPKDRFHFTYATSVWEALSEEGENVGYGVIWDLVAASPPRQLVVALVQPGTPAASAGLGRGDSIVTIDGVNVENANDATSINTLNAGISPASVGESHTFVVAPAAGGATRTVTLIAANIDEVPVPTVASYPEPGGVVGYINFNSVIATAESELIAAVNQLASAGATDLVLDLRYNGGGYLDIASELAYMIAGPGPTTGATFELDQFNAKYPTTDPITGAALAPTPFFAATQGFSTTAGEPLPTLGLKRLYVLTTGSTCSASEAVINSLRGVGISVYQIGSTTCGKPYGFYPTDNCGTTYFSIQFQGVNNVGFGDYPDGFTPANSTTPASVSLPGCAVADDFTHALGDPAEALFAAALGYRANGSCPPVPVTAAALSRARVVRPAALLNRILGHPRRPAAH
jgi:hypothetical protein